MEMLLALVEREGYLYVVSQSTRGSRNLKLPVSCNDLLKGRAGSRGICLAIPRIRSGNGMCAQCQGACRYRRSSGINWNALSDRCAVVKEVYRSRHGVVRGYDRSYRHRRALWTLYG